MYIFEDNIIANLSSNSERFTNNFFSKFPIISEINLLHPEIYSGQLTSQFWTETAIRHEQINLFSDSAKSMMSKTV